MKKLGLALLVSSCLAGCASTSTNLKGGIDNSHLQNLFPVKDNKNVLFAKLEKKGDGFHFGEYSIEAQRTSNVNDAWVNLNTGEPQWNYQSIQRCSVVTATGNDTSGEPCTTASEIRFMERQYDAVANGSMALVTVGLSAAIASYMLVEFQYEEYVEAYQDALSKIEDKEKIATLLKKFEEHKSSLRKAEYSYNQTVTKLKSKAPESEVEKYSVDTRFSNLGEFEAFVNSIPSVINQLNVKTTVAEEKLKDAHYKEQRELFASYGNSPTISEYKAFIKKFRYAKYTDKELYQIAQSKVNEVENRERLAKEKREREKREYSLAVLRNPDSVGEKVCRDGSMKYIGQTYSGWAEFERPGQLQAFIEGHSPDMNRVKLRISGHALSDGTLRYKSGTNPSLGGISVPLGTIVWESVNNWYPCS